jgi:hypothetical protein
MSSGWMMENITHFHQVLKLSMCGAFTTLPPVCLHGMGLGTGTSFYENAFGGTVIRRNVT